MQIINTLFHGLTNWQRFYPYKYKETNRKGVHSVLSYSVRTVYIHAVAASHGSCTSGQRFGGFLRIPHYNAHPCHQCNCSPYCAS